MNKILIMLTIALLQAENSNGLTLFSPIISMPEEGAFFDTYLIDDNSNVINSWESEYCVAHTSYLVNDTMLVRPGRVYPPFFDAGGIGGILQKYNWSGDVVWEVLWANNQYQQHHDVAVMPNGNILLISYDRKSQEEVLALGKAAHNGDFWSETIFEIEPVGEDDYNIVWEWSLFNHLIQDEFPGLDNFMSISNHPEKLDINYLLGDNDEGPFPPQFNNPDFLHLNALDYNSELDLIAFSSRKSGEIYIIDHSTSTQEAATDHGGNYNKGGGFLYRWGNPAVYDRGDFSNQKLFAPHGVNWVEGSSSNLLIFNNGYQRPISEEEVPYSSIEEIETPFNEAEGYYIDENLPFGPEEYFWYYTDNESFSNIQSGAFRQSNGNTLITYTTLSKIIEVSSDMEVVWSYSYPSSQTEYLSRANKYNIFNIGDINYDFTVNILDVVNLIDIIMSDLSYTYIADTNSDNNIDILDVVGIINIIIS